jgi:hypothetical protein
VIDSCKTYISTKCQEKRNLVHGEDISCHKNLFVEFQQLLWDLHIVPGHWVRLAPSGLPFQCDTVLDPNLRCNINALDRHGAVFDLIAPNYPLEILHGRVAQGLVQVSCDFYTLDLLLGKACLDFRDSVNEGQVMFLPQFIIMQPALVHLEFHVWLVLGLSVHNKHQIVTIICDAILIYQIAKCNDVCDGSGAEPYSFVVPLHRCLSSNYHGAAIALESQIGS